MDAYIYRDAGRDSDKYRDNYDIADAKHFSYRDGDAPRHGHNHTVRDANGDRHTHIHVNGHRYGRR